VRVVRSVLRMYHGNDHVREDERGMERGGSSEIAKICLSTKCDRGESRGRFIKEINWLLKC
jgi:hypothetical protein